MKRHVPDLLAWITAAVAAILAVVTALALQSRQNAGLSDWSLVGALAACAVVAYRLSAIARLTQVDNKTGLYNFRHFERVANEELRQSQRTRRPLSLIFVDLDHFKRVNDCYGHAAGDRLLADVSAVLARTVRRGDLAARFGGDEFVVLLPGADEAQAAIVAQRLHDAVQGHGVILSDGTALRCTASIGVVSSAESAGDLATLLQRADEAMYQAKRTRNAVSCASSPSGVPGPIGPPLRRLALPQIEAASGPRYQSPPSAPNDTGHRRTASRVAPALLWTTITAGGLMACRTLLLVYQEGSWHLLLPFIMLGAVAEGLTVQVYEASRQRVSLSFTIAAAMAAMAVHPVVAPLVSATAALVHVASSPRRGSAGKMLFNLANPTLAAGTASAIYVAIRSHAGPGQLDVWVLIAALVAVHVFCLLNVGLVSLMVSLHSGRSLREVTRESFWFAPTNIVLGLTGAFVGGAHQQLGLLGLCMFAAPILVLRSTLTLYARKSEQTIEALRAAKHEVEQAHEEKEGILRRLIETIALIIDTRDNSVSGHSRRVARYALAVGREMGLSPAQLTDLHTAALFHDLGKIGIPELILHKPSRLTDDEYEVIKGHAALGERILAEVPQLRAVARMVGEHHERFDGSGYPKGLAGEEISGGGRILMVVDALETMLADRPYSKGRELGFALAELDRCAGTHFDPNVVEAAKRAVSALGTHFFTMTEDLPGAETLMAESLAATAPPIEIRSRVIRPALLAA